MRLCVCVQTSAPSAAHAAQVSHGHFQPSQVAWWHTCQPRAKAVHTGTTRHSPVHVEGNGIFAVSISLIHMLKVCACCVCVCVSVCLSLFPICLHLLRFANEGPPAVAILVVPLQRPTRITTVVHLHAVLISRVVRLSGTGHPVSKIGHSVAF